MITEKIEDIIEESNILLRDAYERGYNNAREENYAATVPNKELILAFLKYMARYYDFGIVDLELFLISKEDKIRYELPKVISTFLITYNDEEN